MRPSWLSISLLFALVAACQSGTDAQTETRGRVIDQTTGKGISGAIVVAQFLNNFGAHGATSCTRVEQAIADADGWFTMPLDEKAGSRVMYAYSRGYTHGWSNKHATGSDDRWYVDIFEYGETGRPAKIIGTEEKRYKTEREALNASRERIDLYLLRDTEKRVDRQMDLQVLAGQVVCDGSAKSLAPPLRYLEEIAAEQRAISSPPDAIERTLSMKRYFATPTRP